MNDYFPNNGRSNQGALGTTAEGMSGLIPQQIEGHLADKLQQNRKVNSGTAVQIKPPAKWYRRFDKR